MPGVQELTPQTLHDQLQRVTLALGRKYGDRASAADIGREVDEEAAHYRDAHVTQYIPVLVQHAVQERIRHRLPRAPVALVTSS
jgi:hypothetical protein